MRRLTNAEYARTLTDLVGEPPDADRTLGLPEDPRSYGFDNDAEVETISTVHADIYSRSAETVASAVMASASRRALVLGCEPTASPNCLSSFVQQFGRRAYRRPLSNSEVESYVSLATAAGNATAYAGPAAVLQAMLLSPYFLYRVELGKADPARPGLSRLDGFEVATRLSYLLLGTTPDDALLDGAARGDLDTTAGLEAAASKMLLDPRAKISLRRFHTQWLQIDDIAAANIDPRKFAQWNDALGKAMAEESQRFVDSIIWTDGTSFLDLLTARYTFVNGPLAALYGLPAGDGSWRRVDFDPSIPRAGLLTQASVLTLTSHSDSISATKRGLYVRTALLCGEVPSPPPSVAANPPPARPGESERDQFARHTTEAACASCHTMMDPIGWGLSQFDPIGAFRNADAQGQPISAAGRITGLEPPDFTGPIELGRRIRESVEFAACVSRSLYRFAYGQARVDGAVAPIAQNQRAFTESGFDFRKAWLALVRSDAFRYRRLPGGTP